jgi:hypothetical protein
VVPDLKPFLNLLDNVFIYLILPVPGPALFLLFRFQLTGGQGQKTDLTLSAFSRLPETGGRVALLLSVEVVLSGSARQRVRLRLSFTKTLGSFGLEG